MGVRRRWRQQPHQVLFKKTKQLLSTRKRFRNGPHYIQYKRPDIGPHEILNKRPDTKQQPVTEALFLITNQETIPIATQLPNENVGKETCFQVPRLSTLCPSMGPTPSKTQASYVKLQRRRATVFISGLAFFSAYVPKRCRICTALGSTKPQTITTTITHPTPKLSAHVYNMDDIICPTWWASD